MIKGTTPYCLLTILDYDLTGKSVVVTVSAGGVRINKTNNQISMSADNDGTTIALQLSQEDTLALPVGTAEVQVRFIDQYGVALATNIASINVERVLNIMPIIFGGDNHE